MNGSAFNPSRIYSEKYSHWEGEGGGTPNWPNPHNYGMQSSPVRRTIQWDFVIFITGVFQFSRFTNDSQFYLKHG